MATQTPLIEPPREPLARMQSVTHGYVVLRYAACAHALATSPFLRVKDDRYENVYKFNFTGAFTLLPERVKYVLGGALSPSPPR